MRAPAVLLLAALTSLPAAAADPDLCRPYARDLTQLMINRVWTRAYTTCLLLEEDPVVPGSWTDAARIALPGWVPPGEVPASGPEAVEVVLPVPAPRARVDRVCGRRSPAPGVSGSEERRRWCAGHYRSFDPVAGTVRCPRKKGPQPCA
jgi:hypothetical protein